MTVRDDAYVTSRPRLLPVMMFVSLTQAFEGDSLGQRLLAVAALVAVVAVTIAGLSST